MAAMTVSQNPTAQNISKDLCLCTLLQALVANADICMHTGTTSLMIPSWLSM